MLHKYEPFLLNPPICMLLYLLRYIFPAVPTCIILPILVKNNVNMVQARKMTLILIANLIFQRGDRDSEFLRHLHVRLPEVHGLPQHGKGEEDHHVKRR